MDFLYRTAFCGMNNLKLPAAFIFEDNKFYLYIWKSDSLPPHGILEAGILEWVACPFTKGSSQPRDWTRVSLIAGRFPHRGQILYQLSHNRSPRILEWVAYSFSSGSSPRWNWTGVSCITGRFFTNWAIHLLNTYSLSNFYVTRVWWRKYNGEHTSLVQPVN